MTWTMVGNEEETFNIEWSSTHDNILRESRGHPKYLDIYKYSQYGLDVMLPFSINGTDKGIMIEEDNKQPYLMFKEGPFYIKLLELYIKPIPGHALIAQGLPQESNIELVSYVLDESNIKASAPNWHIKLIAQQKGHFMGIMPKGLPIIKLIPIPNKRYHFILNERKI